jgi:antitoxin component YwqK of YwqJK toxin-antitoxin module
VIPRSKTGDLYFYTTLASMPRFFNLLLIVTLGYLSPANACICDYRPLDESIGKATFIAHVQIMYEGGKVDPITYSADRLFRIIELFKGDSLKKIREYSIGSSCAVGIQHGEEWLIFAYYDSVKKEYAVGGCTASRRLKNKEGERGTSWSWGSNEGTLQFLRKYFGHTSPESNYISGQYKSYYPDGHVEWEATYENSQLQGKRKIYFANGIFWQNENYKAGKKEGIQQRYARSGQLLEEMNYTDGEISAATYWYDTSYLERSMQRLLESFTMSKEKNDSILSIPPVIQKRSASFYDHNGNYQSSTYNLKGWLESEAFAYDSGSVRIACRYEESGKLESESIVTKYNDHTTEKKWNLKGELISCKEWEKGKFLGDKLSR